MEWMLFLAGIPMLMVGPSASSPPIGTADASREPVFERALDEAVGAQAPAPGVGNTSPYPPGGPLMRVAREFGESLEIQLGPSEWHDQDSDYRVLAVMADSQPVVHIGLVLNRQTQLVESAQYFEAHPLAILGSTQAVRRALDAFSKVACRASLEFVEPNEPPLDPRRSLIDPDVAYQQDDVPIRLDRRDLLSTDLPKSGDFDALIVASFERSYSGVVLLFWQRGHLKAYKSFLQLPSEPANEEASAGSTCTAEFTCPCLHKKTCKIVGGFGFTYCSCKCKPTIWYFLCLWLEQLGLIDCPCTNDSND